MDFSFSCPLCQAQITGTAQIAGRQVRCPECDGLVTAEDSSKGTVKLLPQEKDHEKTVLLEAVEVTEAVEPPPVVEVTAAVASTPSSGRKTPVPLTAVQETQPAAEASADASYAIERRIKTVSVDIDMTPMVDVTFLLLIFFMVTATFTLQKSLEIPKSADQDPSTAVVEEEPREQSDFVTVIVDEFNTFQVVTIDWEEEAPSEQDLHEMLRKARGGDSSGTVPTKLRVEAHGDSLHQKVVAAIDAGTANGFDEVLLASVIDD